MTDKTQEAALAQRLRDCLTPTEREISDAAGYGKRIGFGSRPAILLVDATYSFCGREPKPILESIAAQRRSCGEFAWETVEASAALLVLVCVVGVQVI